MLEKDRALRPQTPSELRQEIEKCLAQIRSGDAAETLAASDAEEYETVLEDAPTQPSDTKFEIGAVVANRYKITTRLGDTNTGVVFRAERVENGEPVRLLLLHRELTSDPVTVTQIEREVEKVAPVQHPNLLRIFELETVEGTCFITLDWTEGFSLLEVLRARRELEAVEVLKLLGQAADGVDHALGAGIKHLDLALHQIFVHFSAPFDRRALLHQPVVRWPAFVLKLNPLGITRELSASETWSGQQTMVGRPGSSTAEASEQSRAIQALGAVVYELLGGTLSPLGSGTDLGTRYTPLANLTEQGNEALRHALAVMPPYKKAYEFYRALAEVDDVPVDLMPPPGSTRTPAPVAAKSIAPPPPIPVPPPLPPHSQPSRSGAPLAIAAMLVALILFCGGAWYFVVPLFRKPVIAQQDNPAVVPDVTSTEEPSVDPPVTPPKQDEKPPFTPSRTELLKQAAKAAQSRETAEDWPGAISEWAAIKRDFPESEAGKVRLEMIIDELRKREPEVNQQDFASLREEVTEAAELDIVAAMMFLAENLRASEPAESFRWYSAAADRGQLSALTITGLMLSNGYGCEKDLNKAVDALRRAAALGDARAKTALADCYLHGTNVPQDSRKAVELLLEAVEGGDARGMDLLATCYDQGNGTARNPEEALRLYTRAAELGFNHSLGNLAVLFITGKGSKKADPLKAVELLQKGARANDDFCLLLYAKCLETGTGVKANSTLARDSYKKAAEAGNGEAQKWCTEKGVDYERPSGPAFNP